MGSFNIFVCLLLSSGMQAEAASDQCCECCAPGSTSMIKPDSQNDCKVNGVVNSTIQRCINFYGNETDCTAELKTNQTLAEKSFPECYGLTSPPPTVTVVGGTTTMTALDSSASSNSGDSSASLGSLGYGPGDSSSGYSSGSYNQGSWASDSSGSAVSSGSTASGSWGSQLPIWMWIWNFAPLLCFCTIACTCFGGMACCAAMMAGGEKKKRAKKSKPAAAAPVAAEAPEPVLEPLMAFPPLMPLATTSMLTPSYSMVAQPQMATISAPMTASYAAPMTTSYAAPMNYAAQPQMATYAMPATGYNFGSTGQVIR